MPFVSINPATGQRIATYRTHTRAECEQRLSRSTTAQREWRRIPAAARAALLKRLGAELRRRSEALAALATEEMGKPISQSRGEVEKCATLCDFYAAQGPSLLTALPPAGAKPGRTLRDQGGEVVFDPLGVVLAIMPWNFPYWQVFRACVPAVLAGNTILLKHAPSVPGCSQAIEQVFAKAGFPRGIVQSVFVDTPAVAALIADSRVAGVTLTGSTRAGRSVAALAGAALKPMVCELGGSDAFLVCADADLEKAADVAVQSRLLNSGQSCICAKRIVVDRRVRRAFEERFLERFAAKRLGVPTDPATEVGPLARADLRDQLDGQVDRSVKAGAKLLLGGHAVAGRGFFYEPTVLGAVMPGMAAFDEETFGPVAVLVSARDEAHAVALANTSRFGLGATVFTADDKRGRSLASALDAGCVFINDLVKSTPGLPFGGIKESGFGRELGAWGVQSFANIKTVCWA